MMNPKQKLKGVFTVQGGLLNQAPLEIFESVQHSFLDSSRDQLVIMCSARKRCCGLGIEAMAGLWTAAIVERDRTRKVERVVR